MLELVKNIGLGLFVNGSYAMMNGLFSIQNIIIAIGSVLLMAGCILYAKRNEERE
ncbi:hypothetical protein [Helicobacter sp. MIT 01-3238]|uniref:hypothetical protein n=1 Tax=Helicobacter sp. MIT 01-3238 TaxID=398627 RepID=UPI0015F156A0|nr:hypothetical protein [Helicobacter sp. MIT 01-3238]